MGIQLVGRHSQGAASVCRENSLCDRAKHRRTTGSARLCRFGAAGHGGAMRTNHASAGVALLLVLWTLAILSAIALTLAASVGTEVRASQDLWNDLQADRLAKGGQEI